MHGMRSIRLAVGFAAAALVAGVVAAPAAQGASTTIRIVDDDGHASVAAGCGGSKAAPATIQAAIDASDADDLVRVCPGTYRELLTIGAGRDGLVVKAVTPGTVVVRPPAVTSAIAAAGAPAGGDPGLVRIDSADRVALRGMALVAPTGGGCRLLPELILVSGGARQVLLRNLQLRPGGSVTLDGVCGYGSGVRITSGSAATLDGVTVRDFQGAAVWAAGSGARVTVKASTLAFEHATAAPRGSCLGAGLQLDAGADGILRDTVITGLDSAALGTGTPVLCNGVQAVDATTTVAIHGGSIRATFNGMFLSQVTGLLVEDVVIRKVRNDGMQLYAVLGGQVRRVSVRGSADNGIKLDGDAAGVSIHDNDFRQNGGTDCLDESSGAGTAGTANTWLRDLGGQSDPAGICTPAA